MSLFRRAVERLHKDGIVYLVHRVTGELQPVVCEEFQRWDAAEVERWRLFLSFPPANALSKAMRWSRN